MTTVAIGSYTPATGGRGHGITLARADGSHWDILATEEADSPSFLDWSTDGTHLYVVEETTTGAVRGFHAAESRLATSSVIPTGGGRPCHLAIHRSGRLLITSDYAGGTFTAIALNSAGEPEGVQTVISHEGAGAHPVRQQQPHPHTALFTPDGSGVLLLDLGLDTITLHRIGKDLRIEPEPAHNVHTHDASGPRRAAWVGPNRFVVVEEISAQLSGYCLGATGIKPWFAPVHTTLAADPDAWPAELVVLDPHTVAVTNRRPASVAIISLRANTAAVQSETRLDGRNPRHASLIAGSTAIAFQDDDTIAVLASDGVDATSVLDTGSPSCIQERPGT